MGGGTSVVGSCKVHRTEVVVVRPSLVYDPGVKGNFARLIYGVRRGVPFPFGSVRNCRSLVGLDNLTDILICCSQHPRASGRTFLVSDGEDLSTPGLIRRLAHALDRPVRLVPFPIGLMQAGARLLGRTTELDRLVGSLQVGMGHTCRTLDWVPPVRLRPL
jgi:nucleoside-diphosphate-sugar epimerase